MNPFVHAACLAALLPALAVASPEPADPAEPDAPVPAPTYRSVFQDTPTGVEDQASDWRHANAEVGQFRRGHVDLLKWENNAHPAGTATPPATPMRPGMHMHHGPGGQR